MEYADSMITGAVLLWLLIDSNDGWIGSFCFVTVLANIAFSAR